jgi:hypothetical protein
MTKGLPSFLEVTLHSNGGSLIFDADTHKEFVGLYRAIGRDKDTQRSDDA